jgi:hypothetical protein
VAWLGSVIFSLKLLKINMLFSAIKAMSVIAIGLNIKDGLSD